MSTTRPASADALPPASAAPAVAAARVVWRGVFLYIVLAYALSWAAFIGLHATRVPFAAYAALGMFGPALACALVRGPLRREGFADAGLAVAPAGHRAGRYYAAAYVVVPALLAAGAGLSLLTHAQHWALAANVARLQRLVAAVSQQGGHPRSHAAPSWLVPWIIPIQVATAFTIALPINMLFTFGEELGWRGYLLPRLAPLGEMWAAVIVGVVWGLWHAPLILEVGYNYPGHRALGAAMMAVACVPLSMVLAWLRFRSGSIWPGALAHAALNAQAGVFLLALSAGSSLIRPPVGWIGVAVTAAFCGWLIASSRLKASAARREPPAWPSAAP